jgi:hypothetical protein
MNQSTEPIVESDYQENKGMDLRRGLSRRLATGLLTALALVCTSAFVGCAEEVGDIDRTQTNRLEKSKLTGVWYYMQTMIDVPQQTNQGFIGNTNFGNSAKVMFDVQEEYILVLPVVETVQFAEAPYKTKKVRNYWDPDSSDEFVDIWVGEPIAMFPITSHFDVMRDYSASTGKQSNVIVENTTDRVWHARKYMRVNWGANMLLDWGYPTGTKQFSPVDHYVQEGEDPYLAAPGQGTNPDFPEFTGDYVSFVTKAYMPPSGADWQGYACSPYGISNKDCAGSVIKVRHSFKQAEATPDYETFVYTNGEHMDKFGYFLADRYAYDELWNLTESARDYKAQRWNLWQTTWTYQAILDENGAEITCSKDLDCGTDSLVLDTESLKCYKDHWMRDGYCATSSLKPFSVRGLSPIIYHQSAYVHEEVLETFYESADEWSKVFKTTVANLLTLEKHSRYWVKPCSTSADCISGRDDVIADAEISVAKVVPANAADGCPAGSVAVGDECLSGVSCNSDNPCGLKQICSTDGLCHHKNEDGSKGGQVAQPALTGGPGGLTAIFYPDDSAMGGHGVIRAQDDNLAGVQVGAGECLIRFVNASPNAASATLKTAAGSTLAADVAYNPATLVKQGVVVSTTENTLSVEVDGTQVAQAPVPLEAGKNYLAVFVGGNQLVVAGTQISMKTGLRFMHAAPGVGAVDVGITGVRVIEGLNDGALSDYVETRYDTERVTVIKTGAEGDVTCYHTMHEGRCIGWRGDWPAQMEVDYQQTLNDLPDMFVICENQYDAGTTKANYEGDKGAGVAKAHQYNDARYTTVGSNPYAVTGQQDLASDQHYNPCGDADFVTNPTDLKKIGDARYNYMYWVAEAQAASPLGYGPSAGDPETGELFWATAYVYGAPTLTYGQYGADLVDLINGKLDATDVITGQYVRDYIQAKGDPLPMDNSAGWGYGALDLPTDVESMEQVFEQHGQFDRHGVIAPMTDPLADNKEILQFLNDENYRKSLFNQLPTVAKGYAQARMDKIRGTYIEDLMTNEEVRLGLTGGGLIPGQALSEDLREQLSPATWATSSAVLEEREYRNKLMAHGPCAYDREFVDDNIYGLAKEFFCTEEQWAQQEAGTLTDKVCKQGDDLRWELTRRIFGGVLEHEIGHTVGLRHNFSGSVDAFNYFDEYYEIREPENVYCKKHDHCDDDGSETCLKNPCANNSDCPKGLACDGGLCVDGTGEETGLCELNGSPVLKFVPRTQMTESERLNKMSEYQYSTVMDYGGRFNSDVQGLGKYDQAAINFGYGKMVDVYADPSKMRARISKLALKYGLPESYFAYFLSTTGWRYAGTIFHPFYYLENYIGVDANKSRLTVPYERVKLEHSMQDNYRDGEINWSFIEVPYRFCSDEYRGNMGCYVWDTGVDIGEIIHNALNLMNDYYVFDAFKRERMYQGSDRFTQYYFSRVMGRYMDKLGAAGRYYAIYDNIFNDRSWYPDFIENPHAMRTLRRASETGFNQLAQALASPAPGSFVQDQSDGVYRNVTYDLDAAGTDLTVPVGVGKFPYTQYMNTENYGFQNHVVWVGSFWLKLGALMTLTDSTFYSSSDWVGEQLEIGRSSAVGFNTLYQREMTNLVGGIVAESFDHYSGVVTQDATGKLQFKERDLFDLAEDASKPMVEPGLNNLTMKLYASVFGLANLPAGFDPSFTDAMTIFLKGSGHEFDLASGANAVTKIEFDDPFGMKTYVAYAPNYDQGRLAVAYKLLLDAKNLKLEWEIASGADKLLMGDELKQKIEEIDILRELHVIYGNLVY